MKNCPVLCVPPYVTLLSVSSLHGRPGHQLPVWEQLCWIMCGGMHHSSAGGCHAEKAAHWVPRKHLECWFLQTRWATSPFFPIKFLHLCLLCVFNVYMYIMCRVNLETSNIRGNTPLLREKLSAFLCNFSSLGCRATHRHVHGHYFCTLMGRTTNLHCKKNQYIWYSFQKIQNHSFSRFFFK